MLLPNRCDRDHECLHYCLVPPCPTMIGVYSFWPRICDCSLR
jgi:hypothetical protein